MKRLLVVIPIVLMMLLIGACSKDPDFSLDEKRINIKWNKAYEDDSLYTTLIGLEWALSHIGAEKTQALYQMVVGTDHVFLDIDLLGFNEVAKQKLMVLHHKLKFTEEYREMGAIDLGRYVALLIGAAEHYYQLVDMPENYFDLLAQYNLREDEGFVDNSIITGRHRIIKFSEQEGLKQFFVAEEINETTGELIEYETIDMMPNGQLRFGIFDANGVRQSSTDPLQTIAGKPAKCMWCHESSIQPLFSDQSDFAGFLTFLALKDTLAYYREEHRLKKNAIEAGVDYSKTQDHRFMELVYISFMEPSAERLSLEWGIPLSEVQEKLVGIPTHDHHEFEFLGSIYYRADVNAFAPFEGLSFSSDVREESVIEVNHLN